MNQFKKNVSFLLTLLLCLNVAKAQQNIGVGTNTPDASARLDISASDKGLLIPRVFLLTLSDATTIASPASGLMVYNTNKTLTGGTGYYYNGGTVGAPAWLRFQTGAAVGSGWNLTGNAATDSTINFLGTSDEQPIVFRVNNGFAGQIGSNGGISFGRGANGTNRITPPGVIAIGDSALFNNTDSTNIAIGEAALYNNITGTNNIALGNSSLVLNTIGMGNVAIGDYALLLNDSSFNTAIGYGALNGNQEGENTAVGAFSMTSNLAGFYNVSVGNDALYSNDYGLANVAVGRASLANNMDGNLNTAAGYISMISNTSGNFNTAFGSYALRTSSTGSYNTAIGDSADVASGALFNTTTVGYKATATTSNSVVIGNSAVTSIGGQVGWSVLSDGRYKQDVNEDVKGLDFILQLRPVSYHYNFDKIRTATIGNNVAAIGSSNAKSPVFNTVNKLKGKITGGNNFSLELKNPGSSRNLAIKSVYQQKYEEEVKQNDQIRYTGFIAQEVEAVAKKVGFDFSGVDKPKNENDQYALRYAEFVVPLVKAMQEQQTIIEAQNKKIDALVKRLEILEQQK